MNISFRRGIGSALIALLLVMQTGSAWATTMHACDAADGQRTSMMMFVGHGAAAGDTQNVMPTDNGCDNRMNSDCASCAHCIAVAIEFDAIGTIASAPHADRVNPSIKSLKRLHFKPPRLV